MIFKRSGRKLVTVIATLFILAECGGETKPDEDEGGGGVPPPPSGSVSCYCQGSVLLQSKDGQISNLGDYGTAQKCQEQLRSGHPGCP